MAMPTPDLNPHIDIRTLDTRSQAIMRLIVDSYVHNGEAIGSQTLSQNLARLIGMELSPATIRNTMADLETAGLLYSPHISAGRLPTDAGLRLFVNNMLETQPLDHDLQDQMQQQLGMDQHHLPQALERASFALSSLSRCAGLVVAPTKDKPFKQVEFVSIATGKVLVVWVADDGTVENRIVETDPHIQAADLQQASEYMNRHLHGKTLHQARTNILDDITHRRHEMNRLTETLVTQGLVIPHDESGIFIVRGQGHLLHDVRHMTELERLRKLFDTLEQRETMLKLVEQTAAADGIQIFIGAESELFNHSGCAMIVAPYKNRQQHVIGAIGIIGPNRMNYGRIIPMVDYTAKLLSGVQ